MHLAPDHRPPASVLRAAHPVHRSARLPFPRRLAALALLVLLLVPLLSGCRGSRSLDCLDSGQLLVEPVVAALESHRSAHGRYPATLDELVSGSLIRKIPEIPPRKGTLDVFPLKYEVSPDGDLYYLHFAYDIPGPFIADIYTRYLISSEKVWKTRRYPPWFEDLLVKHKAKLWRQFPSDVHLKATVDALVARAMRGRQSPRLYRLLANDALGSGTLVQVPADLESTPTQALCYEAPGGKLRYCIIYKPEAQWSHARISPRDPYIADRIYTVEVGNPEAEWELYKSFR